MSRQFNGSSDRITPTFPRNTSQVSICYSYKRNSATGRHFVIWAGAGGAGGSNYYLYQNATVCCLGWYSGAYNEQTFAHTADTSLHRICWVADWDADTIAGYIDGVSQSITLSGHTTTPSTSTGADRFGELSNLGFDFANGDLAEVGVWTGRALTADEAIALTKGYSPLAVRRQNLAAYWPLYGNLSNEPDIVGGTTCSLTGTSKAAHPRMIYPRRRRIYITAAAAGQTIAVGQTIETDLAQAITHAKAKLLGQATETDLAQAITARKIATLAQATETDTAQALTARKAATLGQATETDTAQSIARAKAKALGQTIETDLAQAITASGNKIIAVGQVTETDTAQALTARKAKALGQTTETDTAQAIAHAKTKLLGQATETDLAQAITPSVPNQVGQATETELAQPLSVRKAKTLGQITETDVAQAVTSAKTKGLGLALEIDLGQPITWAPKIRRIAQATETDLAQTIVASLSSTQLPLGKRYTVGPRVGFRVGARNNFRVDQ